MNKKTKVWLIAATSLILIGIILFSGMMTVLKWDFLKLSTTKFETNNYEIKENFKNLSIKSNTADIIILPSENGETFVSCEEEINLKHTVTVNENTLSIKIDDTRKWYQHIGISFSKQSVTVTLPKGEYDTLSINNSTGDVKISKDLSFESVDISVSTGDIIAENIYANSVKLASSTGKTNLSNIKCKNLVSSGNTGNIMLQDVICTEKIYIKRSTGNVNFELCDANELLITTDTGNVKGSLLSDKVFITKTDTGKINVPKTITGGKCEITTDTGDIKITIK